MFFRLVLLAVLVKSFLDFLAGILERFFMLSPLQVNFSISLRLESF